MAPNEQAGHVQFLLSEAKRSAEAQDKLWREIRAIREADLPTIRTDIALLKQGDSSRSRLWGFMAGCVPAILMILWQVWKAGGG